MQQVTHRSVRPVRHQFMSLCNRVDLYYVASPGVALCCSARLILFTLAEDRPDNPGILVRQGYRGDVLVASAH